MKLPRHTQIYHTHKAACLGKVATTQTEWTLISQSQQHYVMPRPKQRHDPALPLAWLNRGVRTPPRQHETATSTNFYSFSVCWCVGTWLPKTKPVYESHIYVESPRVTEFSKHYRKGGKRDTHLFEEERRATEVNCNVNILAGGNKNRHLAVLPRVASLSRSRSSWARRFSSRGFVFPTMLRLFVFPLLQFPGSPVPNNPPPPPPSTSVPGRPFHNNTVTWAGLGWWIIPLSDGGIKY